MPAGSTAPATRPARAASGTRSPSPRSRSSASFDASAAVIAAHSGGASRASSPAGTLAACCSGAAAISVSSQPFARASESTSASSGASATGRAARAGVEPASMCGEYQPLRTACVRHAAARWPLRCSISPTRASVFCTPRPRSRSRMCRSTRRSGACSPRSCAPRTTCPDSATARWTASPCVRARPGRDLLVVGESRAGRPAGIALGDGEAIRISTGAMVPDGADAVLQQELVERPRRAHHAARRGRPRAQRPRARRGPARRRPRARRRRAAGTGDARDRRQRRAREPAVRAAPARRGAGDRRRAAARRRAARRRARSTTPTASR